jgi:hypothetical protein
MDGDLIDVLPDVIPGEIVLMNMDPSLAFAGSRL